MMGVAVEDERFTQTVKDDPCDTRRESFDGVVFKRVSPPTEDELTMDKAPRDSAPGLRRPRRIGDGVGRAGQSPNWGYTHVSTLPDRAFGLCWPRPRAVQSER